MRRATMGSATRRVARRRAATLAGVAATLLAAGLGTIASPGFASAGALEVDGGVLERWVLPADLSAPDVPPPGADAGVTAAP